VFEDPEWLPKILIGGLFYLACFLLIGIPFVLGYLAVLVRNLLAGVARPLPSWGDLGDLFGEGVKLSIVGLAYIAPQLIITLFWVFGTAFVGEVTGSDAPAMLMGCMLLLFVPLFILISVVMPAALLHAAATGRIEDGFDLPKLFGFIGANFGNYVLAFVIHLIGGFLAQFGVILLCIGVIFTVFWSTLVSTHAFTQVYQLSEKK
jgi:hypothetical protein